MNKVIIKWIRRVIRHFSIHQERREVDIEHLNVIVLEMEDLLRALAEYRYREAKVYGLRKDPEVLYREYREGMKEDLFDLFAFVATWDGVLDRKEFSLIRQVVGEALSEEQIFNRARSVEKEMELWEPECGGSGLIRILTCWESTHALHYIEKLLEAGHTLLDGGRRERGKMPLELMAIYLRAQSTHSLSLAKREGEYQYFDGED
jgi:hypothetical protein